ncbi:hypothetical protein MAHJHV51_51050 [Mycobacterium avium subsp. hominissuis]
MSLMLTRTGNFDACTAINPGGICPIIKREVKFTTETVKKPLASTEEEAT